MQGIIYSVFRPLTISNRDFHVIGRWIASVSKVLLGVMGVATPDTAVQTTYRQQAGCAEDRPPGL